MGARAKSHGTEPSCLYPDDDEIAAIVLGPRARLWTGLAAVLVTFSAPAGRKKRATYEQVVAFRKAARERTR